MRLETKGYIARLYDYYSEYNDQDSLMALADEIKKEQRIEGLKIYRKQQKTQELISMAVIRFRMCVEKLTDPAKSRLMTDEERAYCFAAMDWARYTLDVVGEDPNKLEQEVEKIVESYARKAGLIE